MSLQDALNLSVYQLAAPTEKATRILRNLSLGDLHLFKGVILARDIPQFCDEQGAKMDVELVLKDILDLIQNYIVAKNLENLKIKIRELNKLFFFNDEDLVILKQKNLFD